MSNSLVVDNDMGLCKTFDNKSSFLSIDKGINVGLYLVDPSTTNGLLVW